MSSSLLFKFEGARGLSCFFNYDNHSRFSHDVTTATLVSPNKETAAMLVTRSTPPGIELYYCANVLLKIWLLIT